MPEFEQMSIFDVLPEEDWGDAKPIERKPVSPITEYYERYYKRNEYHPDIAPVQRKTLPETADNVCVWCGEEFSDLTSHESGCSPS